MIDSCNDSLWHQRCCFNDIFAQGTSLPEIHVLDERNWAYYNQAGQPPVSTGRNRQNNFLLTSTVYISIVKSRGADPTVRPVQPKQKSDSQLSNFSYLVCGPIEVSTYTNPSRGIPIDHDDPCLMCGEQSMEPSPLCGRSTWTQSVVSQISQYARLPTAESRPISPRT